MTLAAERWGFSVVRDDHLWLRVRNIDKTTAASRFLVEVFAEVERGRPSEVFLLRRAAGRLRYVPQLRAFSTGTMQILAPVSIDLLPFAEARVAIVNVGIWENRCPVEALPGCQCILEAGHEGFHRYRCSSRFCPGWPMLASSLPHPTPPCF